MPDRGEGRFNRVAGANGLPMLGREVEESHEFTAVFLQTQCCLGIFGFIDFEKQIERRVSIGFGLCLPDIVQRGFGFWLGQFGQAIEHIHGLVHPTALLTGYWEYLFQCGPEAHGTIADG